MSVACRIRSVMPSIAPSTWSAKISPAPTHEFNASPTQF